MLSDFHIKDELSWSRRLVDMRFVLFFFSLCVSVHGRNFSPDTLF